MKLRLPKLRPPRFFVAASIIASLLVFSASAFIVYVYEGKAAVLRVQKSQSDQEIVRLLRELDAIRNDDQVKKNNALSQEIQDIQSTYKQAVGVYEALIDLRAQTKDTAKLEEALAGGLRLLSERRWASASAVLTAVATTIETTKATLAARVAIPANVLEKNTAPESGYSRQSVKTDAGVFLVDIVAADMGSTRVIVDTASNETCTRDCPALALSEYVSRSGAFAGINGSYFCPADYPSCADKKTPLIPC